MVGLDAAAPPGPRPMAGGEAGGAVPPTFGAAPEPGRDRGRSPVAGQDPSGAFPGRTRLSGELGPEATPRFTAGEDGGRIPGRDRGHRHPRNRGPRRGGGRRPFSSPYHLIHLACIERETVPHQLGFTKRLLVAPPASRISPSAPLDDVVGREPLEWAIRCLPGLLHARHVDAVPGQIVARRIAVLLHGHDIARLPRSRSRRRGRAHAHAGAQTRSDAREHGHSPGRACRAGCQAVFQPCTIMLHGCTGDGGRIRSGRQPASLLGLGIQRLLRFALLRRRLLPPPVSRLRSAGWHSVRLIAA